MSGEVLSTWCQCYLCICRFNKALKAKAELLQDIINVIKQGQDSSNTELDRTSSVFRYNLEARRQTQTSVSFQSSVMCCCTVCQVVHCTVH